MSSYPLVVAELVADVVGRKDCGQDMPVHGEEEYCIPAIALFRHDIHLAEEVVGGAPLVPFLAGVVPVSNKVCYVLFL